MINERQQKPEMAVADGAKNERESGAGAGERDGDAGMAQSPRHTYKNKIRVCVRIVGQIKWK